MPRAAHANGHSRSESFGREPRHSSDCAPGKIQPSNRAAVTPPFALAPLDLALLGLLLTTALVLILRTGFANGRELWPFPDSLEYATAAINLDRGLGPVLHFGGHTYPTRYPIGFPLILAAINPLLGGKPQRLCFVTAAMALVALVLLYLFTRRLFGRAGAMVAGILLATSPEFTGYSTYVMSDVPALAVALGATIAFLFAIESDSSAAYALCGLLTGFGAIIRPTNGAIVAGFAAALWWEGRKLKFAHLSAFCAACAIFPAVQAVENLWHFGSLTSNGYSFWVPEMYGSMAKAFVLKAAFAPIHFGYTHGNLLSYLLALFGLDGWFGDMNLGTGNLSIKDARYSIFPFAAAAFALIGAAAALKSRDKRAIRAMVVGAGFIGGLLLIYASYFYVDVRFFLPGSFIVFAAAGYGVVVAHTRTSAWWTRALVFLLDATLVASVAVQSIARISSPPSRSRIVPAVLSLRSDLAGAIVVSDISLQWLELYAGGQGTEFVALTTLHENEPYTEYHVHWLYDWKSDGANVQVPAILCPGGELDRAEAAKLGDAARSGRPVYLLVSVPRENKWALVLNREFIQIDSYFSHRTVVDTPAVGLYRLLPR